MVTAVILDMDGLMFDTEPLARDAWRRALADYGYALGDDLYVRCVGRTVTATCATLVEALGEDLPIGDIEAAKARYLRESLASGPPAKPGLRDLLGGLARLNLPIAVASSTERAEVDRRLRHARMRHHFAAIVGGDEAEHGKPAPDLFLLAAQRLRADPGTCVVLEDSGPGIAAAAAAGMQAIMVPDLIAPSAEVREQVVAVVPSLTEALEVIRGH